MGKKVPRKLNKNLKQAPITEGLLSTNDWPVGGWNRVTFNDGRTGFVVKVSPAGKKNKYDIFAFLDNKGNEISRRTSLHFISEQIQKNKAKLNKKKS